MHQSSTLIKPHARCVYRGNNSACVADSLHDNLYVRTGHSSREKIHERNTPGINRIGNSAVVSTAPSRQSKLAVIHALHRRTSKKTKLRALRAPTRTMQASKFYTDSGSTSASVLPTREPTWRGRHRTGGTKNAENAGATLPVVHETYKSDALMLV